MSTLGKSSYVMEFKFHLYTIAFEEKRVEDRREYFNTIEDLIKAYRERKSSLFAGMVEYNTDFKLYKAILEEIDIDMVEALM